MVTTLSCRGLETRTHWLPDGRRVTVRRAVPSDAPRLVAIGVAARGDGLVVLDDHGAIVGHAAPGRLSIAERWMGSGLDEMLERELIDSER